METKGGGYAVVYIEHYNKSKKLILIFIVDNRLAMEKTDRCRLR